MIIQLIKLTRPALKVAGRIAPRILTAVSGYFVVREAASTAVRYVGNSAAEAMSNSLYFVIFSTSLLFIFSASFLPAQILLNKKVSVLILAAFGGCLGTSKPVLRELKKAMYSGEFLVAERYEKKQLSVSEIYDVLGVKNAAQKNDLLVKLIRGGTTAEVKLMRQVTDDLKGRLSSKIDREKVTLAAVQFGSPETLEFLQKKGAIELDKTIKYVPIGLWKYIAGPQRLTALQIAEKEKNTEMIEALNKLKK